MNKYSNFYVSILTAISSPSNRSSAEVGVEICHWHKSRATKIESLQDVNGKIVIFIPDLVPKKDRQVFEDISSGVCVCDNYFLPSINKTVFILFFFLRIGSSRPIIVRHICEIWFNG